jgi:hypothetical protein
LLCTPSTPTLPPKKRALLPVTNSVPLANLKTVSVLKAGISIRHAARHIDPSSNGKQNYPSTLATPLSSPQLVFRILTKKSSTALPIQLVRLLHHWMLTVLSLLVDFQMLRHLSSLTGTVLAGALSLASMLLTWQTAKKRKRPSSICSSQSNITANGTTMLLSFSSYVLSRSFLHSSHRLPRLFLLLTSSPVSTLAGDGSSSSSLRASLTIRLQSIASAAMLAMTFNAHSSKSASSTSTSLQSGSTISLIVSGSYTNPCFLRPSFPP